VGKTWLACALGERACRDDRSVRYERAPRLLADLGAMRGTGRHARRMRSLGRAELLILDDWAMEPFDPEQRHVMLELLDERYGTGSTLIASPLPVEQWPAAIGDGVVAAAILDRIVPNTHRLRLVGDSLRDRSSVGSV
jgi:DNA replication protein DnaC